MIVGEPLAGTTRVARGFATDEKGPMVLTSTADFRQPLALFRKGVSHKDDFVQFLHVFCFSWSSRVWPDLC